MFDDKRIHHPKISTMFEITTGTNKYTQERRIR